MGVVGIVLVIACAAIGGFIIVDTYLGAPPKPRTFIIVLVLALLGVMLIVVDYNTQPLTTHAELSTGEIEFIYGKTSSKLSSPSRIKIKRNVYPWYSMFKRNTLDITILPDEREVAPPEAKH
ncbi:MAG: hypothetical protein JXA20_02515 [Spirochaetes bacterium]|nr:hypothetical protein [Spirochaetota bacterium]